MGSQKDVMELFAERDLRQHFTEYDGWKIAPAANAPSGVYMYRVSKSKWVGEEVAYVALSLNQEPTEATLAALDSVPETRGVTTRKYLLSPQTVNTACVPPHVRIILMNSFAFMEGKLVWLTKKKHAKHFACEPAGVPA